MEITNLVIVVFTALLFSLFVLLVLSKLSIVSLKLDSSYRYKLIAMLLIQVIVLGGYGFSLYDKKSKDLEIKELVSFSNKRPIVEITTAEPALIEKKVLKAKLLVVSKTNEIQSSTIKIPDGWRYVDHNVIIESKNGNASYTVNLEQNEDGQVQLVTLSANVSPSSFSSYKNWMALDLIVNIEAVN